MALPTTVKRIITIIYTPLFLIAQFVWLVDSIYWKEHWKCIQCRADEKPAFKQQFLYFTCWSMWFSLVVFVTWAYFTPPSSSGRSVLAQRVIRVALPHVCTVMVTYIYYAATNPATSFLDADACYTLGRAGFPKNVTDNKAMVNFLLVCANISDNTVHYLSAPLLLMLLFSNELEYDLMIPYSTIFIIILGVAVGIADTYGSRIYCGGLWFNVGMSILFNFVFHVIFVLNHRGKLAFLCRCCDKETHIISDEDLEEEAKGKKYANGDDFDDDKLSQK